MKCLITIILLILSTVCLSQNLQFVEKDTIEVNTYETFVSSGFGAVNYSNDLKYFSKHSIGFNKINNRRIHNELQSTFGISIGYLEYINSIDMLYKSNFFGGRVSVGEEDQFDLALEVIYLIRSNSFAPSVRLDIRPFSKFLWTNWERPEICGFIELGMLTSESSSTIFGSVGINILFKQFQKKPVDVYKNRLTGSKIYVRSKY
jgi:hypothetical protein